MLSHLKGLPIKGRHLVQKRVDQSAVKGFTHNLILASMQYIIKLATTQCQKPWSPFPQPKFKVMYNVDASVRLVKICHVHKIVLTGPWSECTAEQGPCEHMFIFPSTHICLT
jgi:hypothetical protein